MKSLSRDFMDDLGRLRVLREFRERQSVTATAQALHLTPSAVSQQLAGLSRDLGFAVTQREGRGLVLDLAHIS
jgi:DNA-binding transcriptional LysR family regulator